MLGSAACQSRQFEQCLLALQSFARIVQAKWVMRVDWGDRRRLLRGADAEEVAVSAAWLLLSVETRRSVTGTVTVARGEDGPSMIPHDDQPGFSVPIRGRLPRLGGAGNRLLAS